MWSVRKDSLGRVPLKNNYVLGTHCRLENEILIVKSLFYSAPWKQNSVFCRIGSFVWEIPVLLPFPSGGWNVAQVHGFWAVVLTGVRAFPSWPLYTQHALILPKCKTDEVSPRKHIFHLKWVNENCSISDVYIRKTWVIFFPWKYKYSKSTIFLCFLHICLG